MDISGEETIGESEILTTRTDASLDNKNGFSINVKKDSMLKQQQVQTLCPNVARLLRGELLPSEPPNNTTNNNTTATVF
jgi:hypothetical protein